MSQVAAISKRTNRDNYLSELLGQIASGSLNLPEWAQQLREQATAFLQEQTLPSTRDEEWRFTDLSPLFQNHFVKGNFDSPIEEITGLILPEAASSRLVFVNGIYAPDLSSVADLPDGVFVGNLLSSNIPNLKDYLGKQPGAEEVFTALNTAGVTDAAVVWIPKNLVLKTPIHLLFISSPDNQPIISQTRCLVVAQTGSSVTLVEDYLHHDRVKSDNEQDIAEAELADPVYLTNAVTEIWLGENAEVIHNRIERDSPAAFHIGKTAVSQARDSRYTSNAITLGAKLSRHNLEVFQTGVGTQTTLDALTLIAGEQLADTHSAIALNHPHGTTNQLHKCIVGDRAHAVFNGKVFVPKPAQLTDAAQLNRNLLLSPKARVDTKPQLEITADNVKCSHGATVSQLEAEEVFYLQSRGINENDARKLLINAFATEIIERIPIASVQQTLTQALSSFEAKV